MRREKSLLLSFLMVNSFASSIPLNRLGVKYSTDKSSIGHNYTGIYNRWFRKIAHKPLRFLEIGLFKHASAKMWEEYFPNARLFFLDIDPQAVTQCKALLTPRCSCHLVDQSNAAALRTFATAVDGNFDIIVDDGGHTMQQQIISFNTLFPFIKGGGVYIIEDLHTSFWAPYGGKGTLAQPEASPTTTIAFLHRRISDLMKVGARSGCADIKKYDAGRSGSLTYYQRDISSIHFYNSLCFIVKRR